MTCLNPQQCGLAFGLKVLTFLIFKFKASGLSFHFNSEVFVTSHLAYGKTFLCHLFPFLSSFQSPQTPLLHISSLSLLLRASQKKFKPQRFAFKLVHKLPKSHLQTDSTAPQFKPLTSSPHHCLMNMLCSLPSEFK